MPVKQDTYVISTVDGKDFKLIVPDGVTWLMVQQAVLMMARELDGINQKLIDQIMDQNEETIEKGKELHTDEVIEPEIKK